MSYENHVQFFLNWVEKTPDKIFLRQPFGDSWKETSWKEAFDQASAITASLQSKNIEKGSKIAVLSKNCMHWILADLAISMGGYVSTPFFPNLSKEEFRELINRSEASVLFIGKLDAPVWEQLKDEVPANITVICFPHYEGNAKVEIGFDWDQLVTENNSPAEIHKPEIDDLWTILFTSGTTGSPKGVMLNYKSPAALMDMELKNHSIGIFKGEEHIFFSYLPLNHIAERMIVEIACLLTGGVISFAESLESFAANLESVQPTSFMSVPRIYTKFQLAVLEKLGEKKFDLLMKIPIVNSILKKKLRQKFGLSRAHVILTGAAPTPQSLKNWYKKIGVDLREIYGMTENAGGCCAMPRGIDKADYVGKALTGVDIKTDEDGQILMKAPWLMTGYYKDEENTANTLVAGWLKTGDQGEVTADGYVKLTGRVSDTFKTSKGKFVTPGPLEWALAENTYIEQICVSGLGLDQPLALVLLSEMGKEVDQEQLEENLNKTIDTINEKNPKYLHISKMIVLDDEWSVDNGLLTPTMKIKRNAINKHYQDNFESWDKADKRIIFYKK
ncbi:MAG: AMP-dependent synthetase [Chitinophagaceae bacterium]|nr:MAG: AMP-dependent synthetase [Chitinophagaceae bacterium]